MNMLIPRYGKHSTHLILSDRPRAEPGLYTPDQPAPTLPYPFNPCDWFSPARPADWNTAAPTQSFASDASGGWREKKGCG